MLQDEGLLPHPDPLGKRIRRIHVVVQEVFTPDDPFPDWMNLVHRTTRTSVVRRAMLLREGDLFDRELAEESARYLRSLLLFSVVLIVPVQTDAEDRIDLLVYAKDIFSLRLEWNFSNTGFSFDFLSGSLTERNIAGLGKEGRLRFGLDRGSWRLGQLYYDRRLLGSRWAMLEVVDLLFPRSGGGPEGLVGQIAVAYPLSTTATRWGGEIQASFERSVARRFLGDELHSWDDPSTEAVEALPWKYDRRIWSLSGMLVRSFGTKLKTNLGLGYGVRDRSYEIPLPLPQSRRVRFAEWLHLPPSEQAAYLVGRLHHYANTHTVLHDLESYALSEDVRLGHDVDMAIRPAHELFGSSTDWLELEAQLGYNLLLGEQDLLRISAGARTRLDDGAWINNRITATVKNYSPMTRWGRLVYRATLELGWSDRENTLVSVGGESALRGYLAGSRLGLNAVRQNLEFRSRSWELQTIQLGWVLFWDSGDAFDQLADICYRHSLGAGLRILLP
ncbi:MAG: hypothetical protein FJ125_12555, partial [Deltaproteobacteria bacterium]|nr:hypothetical protein [Deltaproteobacteria bacterium]